MIVRGMMKAGMMTHGILVMKTGVHVTYGTLQQMAVLRLMVLTLSKEEKVREKAKGKRVVRRDLGNMSREFDLADTGSMATARKETIALINMRNVSALLRELQQPHRTLLLSKRQSNLRQMPKRLPRSLPLPLLLAREMTRADGARAKARAKVKRARDIDKHRLVWHEFLHQPLVTLT